MASRNYQQPSAPQPPPYESVANNNRQERVSGFNEFVNRYESNCFFEYYIRSLSPMILFS